MSKVFVDTAAWIALLDVDDALHTAAERVWQQLLQRRSLLLTSDFVLLELADAFSAPSNRKQAIAFINNLWQSPAVKVVPVSRTLLDEGWVLYSQRLDKGWGLTDCTSFVMMTQERITQAFTSDRHFEQAGFTKLL